jgi:hypothetical protein
VEHAAIDLGQHAPADDDVVDELREHIVSAAHRHVLREYGEISVGMVAIV